jgi:hypothetical protein
VPVFYAICVLDLKVVKWDAPAAADNGQPQPGSTEQNRSVEPASASVSLP